MAKSIPKPKSYWTKLKSNYEKIIAKSNDKAHVKVMKNVLKTVINPKIKSYATK
jgi:hypothetical protein